MALSGNWSSGYVTELNYTYGFYRELSPAHLRFASLSKGFFSNTDTNDSLTYCELGCGQGITANIIAAANPEIEVYATDFNPAHIYNAKRLATKAHLSNMHFYDESFEDFAERGELPQFNIISLHGIYSWVAKEHRETIVRFIQKRLKPGGLVYISYNSLPGWAGASPLQHLIRMHTSRANGPLTQRVENALDFIEQLQNEGARYFKSTIKLNERIKDLRKKDKKYIVHEYLNGEWSPFYFSSVLSDLSDAKLSYACSADVLCHVDEINFTPSQIEFLKQTEDGVYRETIQDYLVNRQFRKDIFARGLVPALEPEIREEWLNTRFALSAGGSDIPLKVKGMLGEISLLKESYSPVIEAFSRAGGHCTLREIIRDKAVGELGWSRLRGVIRILVGSGHLYPCHSGAPDDPQRKESTIRLNKVIINQAPHSGNLSYLASPVTGSGLAVTRLSQLFLLSLDENEKSRVGFVWEILKRQRHKLSRDGRAMRTDEENIEVLNDKYNEFLEKTLPLLQSLAVV